MVHAAVTLASLWTLVLAGPMAGQPSGASLPARLEIPYISQDEQLCGGAAAAMLLRAGGVRGVHASDFAPLVDAAAGGIHTRDLERALLDRGHGVRTFAGTGALVSTFLDAGVPVMALVEDRPGRYHYVVVVGWSDRQVVYHDPARAPFLTREVEDFVRSWDATGRWMLTLAPGGPGRTGAGSAHEEAPAPPVEQTTAEASRQLIEKRYAEAARIAWHAARANPSNLDAWRILGASRYLAGDPHGALDAWNRAGDPRVDLVQLEGLSRTPHRTAERLLGIEPGAPLTAGRLLRADRRLALLPSRQASRVSYVALPGNLAEVRGAVVERPLFPSRSQWFVEAARLPIDREWTLSLANLAQGGDRLTGSWRFWPGRPRAAVEFRFPAYAVARIPGVVGLTSEWQRESYTGARDSELRAARISWTDWIAPRARLTIGSGVGRWTERGSYGLLQAGLQVRPAGESFAMDVSVQGGRGEGPGFSSGEAGFRWTVGIPRGDRRVTIKGSASIAHASRRAPLEYWPGAGADPARSFLLRAHPLLRSGAIDTQGVFGRTVLHHTTEVQREVWSRHLVSVAVAGFADAARAWDRADGTPSLLHVDTGVGLRVRLAPGLPAIRLDLARGVRDGRVAFSAGWELGWGARGTR